MPFSQLPTVIRETPILSAISCCERPAFTLTADSLIFKPFNLSPPFFYRAIAL
nr:MAG TPA: hypothetical protein [Bacteriophage sp.]